MLSYQHLYHAGNPVDCQKHCLLAALLHTVGAFHYIDTHSGRGLYDLQAPEARKIAEYRTGIDKIWPLGNWPKELRRFQHLLEDMNPDGVCRFYPGSPMVARAYADTQTCLDLYEIHPQEYQALLEATASDARFTVHKQSGWSYLASGRPEESAQKTGRTVILIDPSYELKEDYVTLPERVAQALARMPDAIILIWYPLLVADRHRLLLDAMRRMIDAPVLQNEITVADKEKTRGIYATGMLCVNPPETYAESAGKIAAWLAQAIGNKGKESSSTGYLLHSP